MKIIALDVHSATFTVAVQNEQGKLMHCLSRDTSEESLIEEVCKVSGQKWVVVEECHLAQWVQDILKPYATKLTVCDPKHNRWIAEDDFTDDRRSAMKLAELGRLGSLREVYHPEGAMVELRSHFLRYHDFGRQVVRFKNKLKGVYRQVGLRPTGTKVYTSSVHEEWLKKLASYPHLAVRAKDLFGVVELLSRLKEKTQTTMVELARKVEGFELVSGLPGVGDVIATGYVALIVTPHRFSRKNKLWRYAGFANQRSVSDNVVYKKRPSKSGNRVLKWVVLQHFQSVVHRSRRPNRFKRQYEALLARGVSKKSARRTVCRSLLSVVRAVWSTGEAYQDEPSAEEK